MHRRIRMLRKALGLNQTDFAKQLGLTQTSLSMKESGRSVLTEKNVKLICSTFHVNEEWLRRGQGDMFTASPYEKELTDIFETLTVETQQCLLQMAKELLRVQQRLLSKAEKGPKSDQK